ncbi:uncharacterized protein LOC115436571 isoform X2 [Sphaeramia orbicularis]|uniref:uncharacterized protein LOC115436571 isoform X2 n=1 Tax=Sphaeramia orbicularis TaxID=375764 RepID=UPI00117F9CDE|nr:uncharacterized protein LOC115436571 isoform X2 [Sphaeramia orbicularis]
MTSDLLDVEPHRQAAKLVSRSGRLPKKTLQEPAPPPGTLSRNSRTGQTSTGPSRPPRSADPRPAPPPEPDSTQPDSTPAADAAGRGED